MKWPDSRTWSRERSSPPSAKAQAYEAERRRAEARAELDRAKTTFFSNVSHEIRTPLTVILRPLQEIPEQPDGTPIERPAACNRISVPPT